MNGRDAALAALGAWRRNGAWADSYLRTLSLDRREAALARQLCFGVIQNKLLLDWQLSRLSTVRLTRMEPALPDILRLGLYQLMFLDRIPQSAAVSEAVSQARAKCSRRAVALCNGILRSACAEALPEPAEAYIKYSHPEWLSDRFTELFGSESATALMRINNTPAPACIQINTLRCSLGEAEAALLAAGARVTRRDGFLELSGAGAVDELELFSNGGLYVQDSAAHMAVERAEPKKGMRVLDACAAPGGKSVAAAVLMQNEGEIIACDIHENKLRQVQQAAGRMGLDCIKTRLSDARVECPEFISAFDLVMADVPCSGLGIIRKKPDIRYKTPEGIAPLPELQLDILKNTAKYVREGGTLLYSTCTLLPEENSGVTERFLKTAPFRKTFEQTLLPQLDGCDGFYICVMKHEGH